jgi:hypothetical protein
VQAGQRQALGGREGRTAVVEGVDAVQQAAVRDDDLLAEVWRAGQATQPHGRDARNDHGGACDGYGDTLQRCLGAGLRGG